MRTIIGRADMPSKKRARAHLGLGVKVTLIPEHALVVEELRHLRVPVARDLERRARSKNRIPGCAVPTMFGRSFMA